jgi:hypothetical protein
VMKLVHRETPFCLALKLIEADTESWGLCPEAMRSVIQFRT